MVQIDSESALIWPKTWSGRSNWTLRWIEIHGELLKASSASLNSSFEPRPILKIVCCSKGAVWNSSPSEWYSGCTLIHLRSESTDRAIWIWWSSSLSRFFNFHSPGSKKRWLSIQQQGWMCSWAPDCFDYQITKLTTTLLNFLVVLTYYNRFGFANYLCGQVLQTLATEALGEWSCSESCPESCPELLAHIADEFGVRPTVHRHTCVEA